MAIKIALLLLTGVVADKVEPNYPFTHSFPEPPVPVPQVDPLTGLQVPLVPVDHDKRHPVCPSEESFFKKDLAFKEVGGMMFYEKPSFHFKGEKAEFIGVDSPFSHAANAASMLMVDEENVQEKNILRGPSKLKATLGMAESELSKAEENPQEMAKSAWENPQLGADAQFLSLRKQLLKQQAEVQRKVITIKDQLAQEEHHFDSANKEDLHKVKFDLWYINMNKSDARRTCIERQLEEAGVEGVNRFPAVEIRGLTKEMRKELQKAKKPEHAQKKYVRMLNELGYGDCVEGGIDWEGTSSHGSQKSNEWHVRHAVVANYCGHKRLLKEQANNKSAAEYIVVMEDDVIIDRTWFKPVIQDFIANWDKKKKWSMVQLDPFGYKSNEDFVAHFRGKPVWKPQFKAPCSQYWGFQAVIFRKDALKEIVKTMEKEPAFPIDWLQYKVDNSIAFSSLIARNPESLSNENWQNVQDKRVVLPSFCAKTVMKSTIARQKVTEGMFETV